MKRVIIVGAGVIGLLLAKRLARDGIDTTVYESKRRVSDNAAKASGIFSKDGLSRLDVGWRGALVTTLNGATIFAGGESFRVETAGDKAYVLERGKFVELCAKEACEAGAGIVLGKRLPKEQILEMKKDANNIIVGADGAVSMVASAVGFPPIGEHILTYKAEYEGAQVPDPHRVELFFSNKIAKRFFGWTVPYSRTKMEVGIGISSLSKKTSTAAFNEFLESTFIKNHISSAKKTAGYASIIPLNARKKTVIDNVLLVGDAAGQVKATTGGGIIFGAACAGVAAGAIIENVRNGAPLLSYEKMWRKRFGLDLKMHRMLHGYYSRMGDRGFAIAIKAAKLAGFEQFFSKYGDMDKPSLMMKRFFLRGMSK